MSSRLGEILERPHTISSCANFDGVTHWSDFMKYIQAVGINDARLSLRDILKRIDRLRYENTARPSTSYANACQMVLNHLDYHHCLLQHLCNHLHTFPSSWKLSTTPAWVDATVAAARNLDSEIALTCEHIKTCRTIVLEQHILQQSQRTPVLTILASIFIPAGFVASYYSMNPSNLNHRTEDMTPITGNITMPGGSSGSSGSSDPTIGVLNVTSGYPDSKIWPTTTPGSFFALAIPLAAVTVFLPLRSDMVGLACVRLSVLSERRDLEGIGEKQLPI
ncbi:hypothetical protein K402DRAFT_423685 [Aulographum hederae CBS 113979]|uniref:Uncharacterized protein n=1 Tax=Aulographum hederae CBS 113979 TaxID=1176131 RepID=A0A6G1GS50_9PEZI|nr:hypothetical protein K402DRAFT_423685 [Aulographum hederae CBS 113979]